MRLEEWTSPAGKRRILTRMEPRERRVYALAVALAFPRPPDGPASFGSPRPGDRSTWIGRAPPVAGRGARPDERCREHRRLRRRGLLPVDRRDGDPGWRLAGPAATRARCSGPSRATGRPAATGSRSARPRRVRSPRRCSRSPTSARRIAGCLPVRWVDDVVFAGDREPSHRAWRAWAATLAELGLREHEGKRSTAPLDARRRRIARRRRSPWHHARVVRSLYRAATRAHVRSPADGRVGAGRRPPRRARGRRRPAPRRPCRRPPGRDDRARVHRRPRPPDEPRAVAPRTRTSRPPARPRRPARDRARRGPAARPRTSSALQGYDETRWTDPTLPTVDALDAVTAAPLVIRRTDGHVALLNTAALSARRRARHARRRAGRRGRRPTGLVTGTANRLVGRWVGDRPERPRDRGAAAVRRGARRRATASPRCTRCRCRWSSGRWTSRPSSRTAPICRCPSRSSSASMDVPKAVELGLAGDRRRPRDRRVDRRPDRGDRRPVRRRPGHAASSPSTTTILEGFFRDGHDAGLQVGMHAIGDRAIEQVLGAWERIYRRLDSRERRHFRARRHRIEHFEMPTLAQIERAAMLGLGGLDAADVRRDVGPPGRALRATGRPGSRVDDEPVPHDPRARARARRRVRRPGRARGPLGDGPGDRARTTIPTQRLTRADAIRIHTTGSARLAHHEEKKGVLEPGMHADLAAYDVDPLAVDDVAGLRPILTVSLGREVWLA